MKYLSIELIKPNPYQPRRNFIAEELAELAKSIQQFGILEPLIIRLNTDREYELIAGERRLRAAKLAGLTEVPVIIREFTNSASAQLALIENLQRSDLHPLEEALAYRQLLQEFCLTQEDIARKLSKSRSHIANLLRLLKLSPQVQEWMYQQRLTMGQAKPLLAITDEQQQIELARQIIERQLSARQVEALVKRQGAKPATPVTAPRSYDAAHLKEFEQDLQHLLGTQVKIKPGKHKSKIEIEYYSPEDLDRFLELLTTPAKSTKTSPIKEFTI